MRRLDTAPIQPPRRTTPVKIRVCVSGRHPIVCEALEGVIYALLGPFEEVGLTRRYDIRSAATHWRTYIAHPPCCGADSAVRQLRWYIAQVFGPDGSVEVLKVLEP